MKGLVKAAVVWCILVFTSCFAWSHMAGIDFKTVWYWAALVMVCTPLAVVMFFVVLVELPTISGKE